MCHNHEHSACCEEHSHSHSTDKKTIFRIIISILLLSTALFFNPASTMKTSIIIFAYLLAGGDILLKAIKNILSKDIFDENFLMSIATIGAVILGEYPEAAMVMILYQTGEFLQSQAVKKSKKSISELMNIRPDYANIENSDGTTKKVAPQEVKINDIVLVKAGEKIPLDGIITDGCAIIDTRALTGESVPTKVKEGDSVISGCINTNGLIKIKVTKSFKESTVSKILKLVEEAGERKTKTENFITKFAKYYTPIVVLLALLLTIIPPIFTGITLQNFQTWGYRALIFLVISCPCALVISIPLSFFAGIGAASKNGILIKGSSFIERLAHTNTIIFDKTGTLTKGVFEVVKVVPFNGIEKQNLIELAAKAEHYSNHPIALSLKQAYKNNETETETESIFQIANMEEIAGKGIKAQIDNKIILVGNNELMTEYAISYKQSQEAGTIVHVARITNDEKLYLGYIVISDKLKEDTTDAINSIKKQVKELIMLTGDSTSAAENISKKTGITKFYAELLPSDKVTKVEEIIAKGTNQDSVIFVGDGINDAPVLTRADVGIAMGALGSDAAIEASDVVIMDDKLSKITTLLKISKKTMKIAKENIIFAIGVKIIFLVLGAMGVMTMWGAVFADVGVTLVAVLNALRILK